MLAMAPPAIADVGIWLVAAGMRRHKDRELAIVNVEYLHIDAVLPPRL